MKNEDTGEIIDSDFELKLEDLEEFVWRWKNHKKMLKLFINQILIKN